jgi:hypothetical protein
LRVNPVQCQCRAGGGADRLDRGKRFSRWRSRRSGITASAGAEHQANRRRKAGLLHFYNHFVCLLVFLCYKIAQANLKFARTTSVFGLTN